MYQWEFLSYLKMGKAKSLGKKKLNQILQKMGLIFDKSSLIEQEEQGPHC